MYNPQKQINVMKKNILIAIAAAMLTAGTTVCQKTGDGGADLYDAAELFKYGETAPDNLVPFRYWLAHRSDSCFREQP